MSLLLADQIVSGASGRLNKLLLSILIHITESNFLRSKEKGLKAEQRCLQLETLPLEPMEKEHKSEARYRTNVK